MKKWIIWLTFLATCFGCRGSEKRLPNFVFIMVDDQKRHQCNFLPEGRDRQGKPTTLCPNIDRLVENGTLLTGIHSVSPVCCPTRYSCLTGTYPSRARNPVMVNVAEEYGQTHIRQSAEIMPDDRTLPKELKKLGYATGAVGKNHVVACDGWVHIGYNRKLSDPEVQAQLEKNRIALHKAFLDAGFDFAERLYHTNTNANGPGELDFHNLEWITEGALEFIDQNADRPFYLYYASTVPHNPLMGFKGNPLATADGLLNKVPDVMPPRHTISERLKAAGISEKKGDILWLDDAVGAIVDKLKEKGILENTVIIYFNDHGVEAGKTSLYQGGMLTFGIVDGPEDLIRRGLKADALCSSVDLPYTILKMAGGDSDLMKRDAVDLSPLLDGKVSNVRKYVYGELGATRAILSKDWKYIAFREPKPLAEMPLERRKEILQRYNEYRKSVGREPWNADPTAPFPHMSFIPGGDDVEQRVMNKYPHYFDRDQLYNLSADPNEQNNLAGSPEYRDKFKEMQIALMRVLETLPGGFGDLKPNEP